MSGRAPWEFTEGGAQFEGETFDWYNTAPESLEGILSGPPDPLSLTMATQLHAELSQETAVHYPERIDFWEEFATEAAADLSPLTRAPDSDSLTQATQDNLGDAMAALWPEDVPDDGDDPSMEVTAQLFPPIVASDAYIAAVDLPPDADHEIEDWFDQPLPDQHESLYPPDVTTDFLATQPHWGEPWIDEDQTEDYATAGELDVVPVLFAPDVTSDFLARQEPLREQPWFADPEPDVELSNDSLDVSPLTLAPDAIDLTQATQPSGEAGQDIEALWPEATPGADIELSNDSLDVSPRTLAPDSDSLTQATLAVSTDDTAIFFPDREDTTEETAAAESSSDDLAAQIQPPDSISLTQATQEVGRDDLASLYDWTEEDGVGPYDWAVSGDFMGTFFPPPAVPDEVMQASQPGPDEQQPYWPEIEPEIELANDSTLDVSVLTLPPDPLDLTAAAQPHWGIEWMEPEQTEDYANDVAHEDVAVFFLPDPFEVTVAASADASDQLIFEEPDPVAEFVQDGMAEILALTRDDAYIAALDVPDTGWSEEAWAELDWLAPSGDIWFLLPPPVAYARPQSDPEGITDALARLWAALGTQADAVGLTDAALVAFTPFDQKGINLIGSSIPTFDRQGSYVPTLLHRGKLVTLGGS